MADRYLRIRKMIDKETKNRIYTSTLYPQIHPSNTDIVTVVKVGAQRLDILSYRYNFYRGDYRPEFLGRVLSHNRESFHLRCSFSFQWPWAHSIALQSLAFQYLQYSPAAKSGSTYRRETPHQHSECRGIRKAWDRIFP